jgi:hypothetical protein
MLDQRYVSLAESRAEIARADLTTTCGRTMSRASLDTTSIEVRNFVDIIYGGSMLKIYGN